MKKNLTEQIIFITKEEILLKIRSDLEKGKTNIPTRLERKIMKDIKDEKKAKQEFTTVKSMKRTLEFLRFGHMLKCYFGLFLEVLCSYSDMLCYFFMIVSMMRSAGFITLGYPFTVFGYALMEEFKPKRKFWYTLLIYTECILLVKFLFQLSFWELFLTDESIHGFENLMVNTSLFNPIRVHGMLVCTDWNQVSLGTYLLISYLRS